ncbi:sulfatase, partial [bacterium]|nr:sulfatase [bacterium]
GCYGYHRNTSPNIDALASRGVKFKQAISNGGHTRTSFPTIMASVLPPLQHAEGKDILQRSVTLAEVLKKSGYHTAAYHSNPGLSHFYGYDQGFDLFDDSFRALRPWRARSWVRGIARSRGGLIARAANKASLALQPILTHVVTPPIINAEEITRKSLKWHETQNRKIFIWLHYMDVHHPYMPENEDLSQFYDQPVSRRRMNILWRKMTRKPPEVSQTEREILINLYDADIKYTDSIIGSLLDRLENQMNNTVVILTADHGDEFGEHGRFGHETLYDGILRVPLIIAGPGVGSGISIKQQVGLINLAPTIVDIAGIGKPRSFYGKNLLYRMGEEEKCVTGTVSTIMNPGLRQRSISYRIPE